MENLSDQALPVRLPDQSEPGGMHKDVDVSGAAAVFTRRQRALLLMAFALVVALRLPHAWTHGRFQDEEATVFLAYAWHHPWLDALFRPFAGYWNVGATATTVFVAELAKAGVLPLEKAPYLTMLMALGVQLLPAVLLLTTKAEWLENRLAVVASLLMISIMPDTEEVFLNVLHIQFHLALCSALILALDVPRSTRANLGYCLILFLAPLCGPGAIVILPLFALRWFLDRDRERLIQLTAFVAGAAVQMLLFYSSSPLRGHLQVDPGAINAALFVRLIVLPLLGINWGLRIGEMIYQSRVAGIGWWLFGITLPLFGGLMLNALKRRDAAIWLIMAGLSIALASFGFGMVIVKRMSLIDVGAGARYEFLPLVLLGLALVVLAMRRGTRLRRLHMGLCLLVLIAGAEWYPTPSTMLANGPSWPAEVAAWRRDHNHQLAVWPRPWEADLSDRVHQCLPPGPDISKSTQPRYCESGWVASLFRER